MECNICDVMSGVPQMACWGEFYIVIYGNMAHIQTAAALCTGEIPSCLNTDPEFQHQPFQQWYIKLHPTLLDTGQSGQLPPGTRGITIGERSCRHLELVKIYIYMYYLLVAI